LGFLQPFPQDVAFDKALSILHGLDQGALVAARRGRGAYGCRQRNVKHAASPGPDIPHSTCSIRSRSSLIPAWANLIAVCLVVSRQITSNYDRRWQYSLVTT